MKYFAFVAFGIVILGGAWFFGLPQEDGKQLPKAIINGVEIELEIARTPEEQARGLSGRGSLEANAGMLFVYGTPAVPGFWMKEMNFPIDIIWIDENKKIVDMSENPAPETFPQVFYSRSPVLYVLEVNANWAKDHNVSSGDTVTFYGIF